MRPDVAQDVVRSYQHVVVPIAHDLQAHGLEDSSASAIVTALILMMAAVHVDDETTLHANEIHDVLSARVLAPELASPQLPGAQMRPEPAFGIGLVPAKLPCTIASPHPNPLPARGEREYSGNTRQ